jgi:hypothetical protein
MEAVVQVGHAMLLWRSEIEMRTKSQAMGLQKAVRRARLGQSDESQAPRLTEPPLQPQRKWEIRGVDVCLVK